MLHSVRVGFDQFAVGKTTALHWAVLLGLSAVLIAMLEAVHLPAALLLGSMIAAILIAATGRIIAVPAGPFGLAQGLVGCLIARGIPASVFGEMRQEWLLFAVTIFAMTVAGAVIGWLLTRFQVLPGTTAVWGSSAGAAMAMTLMSASYGADFRLVAFMQYLRVVLVALCATLVSKIWTSGGAETIVNIVWFPPILWLPLAETLAVAGFGALFGRLLRIPAGSLMLPLALGILLQDTGLITIELPPWLLAIAYALIGWSIGQRFTKAILVHAAKALPHIFISTLLLIGSCGAIAAVLVYEAGIDPLSAYLATSPGGVDSIAIIAASTHVNLPFIMAMQTARVLILLVVGPTIARYLAIQTGARKL